MAAHSPAVDPVKACIRGYCPRCGTGRLFRQVLNLRPRCSSCGLDYTFIDTGDGPAVFAIFILAVLMMGSALYVEFMFSPPVWVHVVAWGLLTPALALALLRLLKGLLIGLQYKQAVVDRTER